MRTTGTDRGGQRPISRWQPGPG